MPSLLRQINAISRCGAIYRSDHLPGKDLNAVHHSYVIALCNHPGISQEELARHLCINKSSVARQLAHLEELGYVERRQSEADKRVTLVYPTEKMEAVLPEIRRISREWNAYLAEDIDEEELERFREILERISLRARQYLDGEGSPPSEG